MSAARDDQQGTEFEPQRGPMIGSILITVGWLIFILLYALYWSEGYTLFQNVIVTIVSLAITALLTAAVWMVWYHPTGEPRRRHKEEIEV